MVKLMRFLAWTLFIAVIVSSCIFSALNTVQVPLSLFFIELPEQAISRWIVTAFVLGGMIGLLLGVGMFNRLKTKAEISRLNKKLGAYELELNKLRSSALKDVG